MRDDSELLDRQVTVSYPYPQESSFGRLPGPTQVSWRHGRVLPSLDDVVDPSSGQLYYGIPSAERGLQAIDGRVRDLLQTAVRVEDPDLTEISHAMVDYLALRQLRHDLREARLSLQRHRSPRVGERLLAAAGRQSQARLGGRLNAYRPAEIAYLIRLIVKPRGRDLAPVRAGTSRQLSAQMAREIELVRPRQRKSRKTRAVSRAATVASQPLSSEEFGRPARA